MSSLQVVVTTIAPVDYSSINLNRRHSWGAFVDEKVSPRTVFLHMPTPGNGKGPRG